MSFFSALRVALDALVINKGRSALTSLGIIIGIAAVIAMVAAGTGAKEKLDERLESVGKSVIIIKPGRTTTTGIMAQSTPLTIDDAKKLREDESLRKYVTGVSESQAMFGTIYSLSSSANTTLGGVHTDAFVIRKWRLAAGRFISPSDLRTGNLVCLLGSTVTNKLFPGRKKADLVGQRVRVNSVSMEVIGILESRGKDPLGRDHDDQVFVPISTLQQRLANEARLTVITSNARTHADIEPAKKRITAILREQHRLRPGTMDDFDVTSVEEMAEIGVLLTNTLNLLVIVIASISLVVGGIGIMNIMLVSVTERTREIGIRMAVGARPSDVRNQFLIESIVLSLGGGLIGVVLGLAIAFALTSFLEWPLYISPLYPALAFVVSAAVGVFFGFYPAAKASKLDPIEALRYE